MYRKALIDIKKKLKDYTDQYDSLSFSNRLQVERMFQVANEIVKILNASQPKINEIIEKYSSQQTELGYYGTWYTLEQSQQIQLQMPVLNHDYVVKAVNAPVDGTRLSKRLYKHRDKLAEATTQSIVNGLFSGKGYKEIAKMIALQTEASYKQALRIARTEGGRTSSLAQQESSERAEELGVKMEKRWLATLDAKTRDTHQALDGQTVPIKGDFTSNGYKAKGPRLFGVASEDINCRCTTINIVNGLSPSMRRDQESKEYIPYKNYAEWLKDKGVS